MTKIISNNVNATIEAAQIQARQAGKDDIFTLQGPMGAGKSEFARAFIRELMGKAVDVPSPTFTLVQNYETPTGQLIWHFDLYRVEAPEEIYEIGWEEALNGGICLIEWPERLSHLMPPTHTKITITPISAESRKINIQTISDTSS